MARKVINIKQKDAKEVPSKRAEVEKRTSVKSYQQGFDVEKQKMSAYSKKFEEDMKLLQSNTKALQLKFKTAGLAMREAGIKRMSEKVQKFNKDIKHQVEENKKAVAHMADSIKFFNSEIKNKKSKFQSYADGPFSNYIKAFWG